MVYNLEALKKERDHIQQEIDIFKRMTIELMERKIQIQALIELEEKRQLEEEELAKSVPKAEASDEGVMEATPG